MRVDRMPDLKLLVVPVLTFVIFGVPLVVPAAASAALPAGKSTFARVGRPPNPDNYRVDISSPFRRLAFEVAIEFAAHSVELNALRAFTRRTTGADVALVCYVGHGNPLARSMHRKATTTYSAPETLAPTGST